MKRMGTRAGKERDKKDEQMLRTPYSFVILEIFKTTSKFWALGI